MTRRSTVRGLTGVLAGGVFAAFAIGDAAEASCKKPCGPCKRCKHGRCRPKPPGTACGECKVCKSGKCGDADEGTACGAAKACCGGACADLTTDPNHCGACGKVCPADSGVCVHGACRCTDGGGCPSGCNCEYGVEAFVCQAGHSDTDCSTSADCPLGSACIAIDPASPVSGRHRCGVAC